MKNKRPKLFFIPLLVPNLTTENARIHQHRLLKETDSLFRHLLMILTTATLSHRSLTIHQALLGSTIYSILNAFKTLWRELLLIIRMLCKGDDFCLFSYLLISGYPEEHLAEIYLINIC